MEHGIEGGTLQTYGNPFGNIQNWTGGYRKINSYKLYK
jgi:hypothetical protein